MSDSEDKIMEFWRWFVKSENLIKNCIENESSTDREYIVDQLNELILNIGTFTWDIGLNDTNEWFLTISPNGDRDLYKVTREVMGLAPEHMNWTFYSSKPAKKWNRKFSIHNYDYDVVDIDASTWEYVAFEEDDGRLELILEANNIQHLDSETAKDAANEFVLRELGEALKMSRIASVEIVQQLESEFDDTKDSILELKAHMEE